MASKESLFEPLQPLESILNPDGTLNLETGFTGSLDTTDWRMRTNSDGTPRFTPAAAPGPLAAIGNDSDWDGRFGEQGVKYASGGTSAVYAMAISGSDLYVGGAFDMAGGISANYIARWNDSDGWAALGSGLNDVVHAIAIDADGKLYAGGEFITAGGASANRIAVWHSSSWSPLGTTTSNGVSDGAIPAQNTAVYAIAIDNQAFPLVYVGGDFTKVHDQNGSTDADYVAVWNSNPDTLAWSVLGDAGSGNNGADYAVYALTVKSSSEIFMGGLFTQVRNDGSNIISASYVAKWDTSSGWAALDSGVNSYVYALAYDSTGGGLYVGGAFTTAGGSSANHIAVWASSNWYRLGTLASNGANNAVRAIILDAAQNYVYIGGSFTEVYDGSTTAASRTARWDGTNWAALGGGANDSVHALALIGDHLFVGGKFSTAGGDTVNCVALYTPDGWAALGHGLDNSVYAIAVDGNNVYVGGPFTTAGGVTVNRIARWDGSQWHALGQGLNNTPYAIAVGHGFSGGDVYVGGGFTQATQSGGGTLSVNYIAKWNVALEQWQLLGDATNNGVGGGLWPVVQAITTDANGHPYVGGGFTQVSDPSSGTQTANRIARWNAGLSRWVLLGTGVGGTSTVEPVPVVFAVAVDSSNNVYTGGDFSTAGGNTASYIAKWNGSTWSNLADGGTGSEGTGGPVHTLAAHGTTIYVGGNFTTAGNGSANYIAKWDGTNWGRLGQHNIGGGNGTNDIVRAIAVSQGGGFVHAGGDFTTVYNSGSSSVTANRIAVWRADSSSWDTYGTTGMNNVVRAIAFGSAYVGGDFGTAGDAPARYFARFTQFSPTAVTLSHLDAQPVNRLNWGLVTAAVLLAAAGLCLVIRNR